MKTGCGILHARLRPGAGLFRLVRRWGRIGATNDVRETACKPIFSVGFGCSERTARDFTNRAFAGAAVVEQQQVPAAVHHVSPARRKITRSKTLLRDKVRRTEYSNGCRATRVVVEKHAGARRRDVGPVGREVSCREDFRGLYVIRNTEGSGAGSHRYGDRSGAEIGIVEKGALIVRDDVTPAWGERTLRIYFRARSEPESSRAVGGLIEKSPILVYSYVLYVGPSTG